MHHYIIPQYTQYAHYEIAKHCCIVSPAGEIIRNSVEFLALFSNEMVLEYIYIYIILYGGHCSSFYCTETVLLRIRSANIPC